MNFCTDMHGPQRMVPTDFCDPLTSHLAQSLGQNFNFSSALMHDPSASAAFCV